MPDISRLIPPLPPAGEGRGEGRAASTILTIALLTLPLPTNAQTPKTAATINAAIAAAQNGDVQLQPGTYTVTPATGGIVLPSNTTLRGAGQGRTIILCDDSADDTTTPCLSSAPGPTSGIHLRDFTIRGMADTLQTPGHGHLLIIQHCTGCSAENLESLDSRVFGLLFEHCDEVTIRGNRIKGSNSDGIAVWSTSNAIIAENQIIAASDDAISAHSTDSDQAPVRSGLVIANNTITESQGIDVLGAKSLQITGNVLRRIMTYGIRVEPEPGGDQGNTANFAVTIANNIITDVFQRAEPNPPNGAFAYMVLGAGPGTTPSLGTGPGALYANAPQPAAGGWFNVHDNTLLRTLPASTSWSQWGYGPALWVGMSRGNPNGRYSGGIPETALAYDGIHISGSLPHSRIAGNLIRTTGPHAISVEPPIRDHDLDGLTIESNQLTAFTQAGIAIPGATNQRLTIRNNSFDGSGTGIAAPDLANTGLYQSNQFRNLTHPMDAPGLSLGNIIYTKAKPPPSTPAETFIQEER